MKNEYIIINKTVIQKRIEGLEKVEQELIKSGHRFAVTRGKIDELISLLYQSTPLIPEIDKAYWAGMQFVGEDKGSPNEYISNLKLDI